MKLSMSFKDTARIQHQLRTWRMEEIGCGFSTVCALRSNMTLLDKFTENIYIYVNIYLVCNLVASTPCKSFKLKICSKYGKNGKYCT